MPLRHSAARMPSPYQGFLGEEGFYDMAVDIG